MEDISKARRKTIVSRNSQEIRYPQRIKEVTSPNLLFPMVFTEVDEFKYIRVPWLEIYSKSPGTLIATLINITCSSIKSTKHGYDAIRISICTSNISTSDHLSTQHGAGSSGKGSATNPVARILCILRPMPPADLLII